MKIKEVIRFLEQKFPLHWQEDFDNCGVQCGDREREITGIVVCFDMSEAVIDEAIAKGERHYQNDSQQLSQVLNSYLGLMMHHKTFRLRKNVVNKNLWIFKYGWIDVRYRKFRQDDSLRQADTAAMNRQKQNGTHGNV